MTIGGKRVRPEMAKVVHERLASLRLAPDAAIQALPESQTTQLELLGEAVAITTYRALAPTGQTLVVAQAVHHRWLGITTEVEAAGFVVSQRGERIEAPEELLWNYT